MGLFDLPDLRRQASQLLASAVPVLLDNLLGFPPTLVADVTVPLPPGFSWQQQLQQHLFLPKNASGTATTTAAPPSSALQQPRLSLQDWFNANRSNHSMIFLAPVAVPQGEKFLRIVDFLSSMVPQTTEEVISDIGHSCPFSRAAAP